MRSASARRAKLGVLATQLTFLGLVVAAWYWASAEGRVSPILLASPDAVMERLPAMLRSGDIWPHLWVTVGEIAFAFAFSLIAGFGVGFWVASGTAYRTRLVEPMIVALYTVPIILFYPIILLIFGFGPMSKIVFAGLYGFFPIALNTARGLRTVNRKYLTAASSMGATKSQLLRKVRIPAALPLIMTGVRVGAAFNLIGVITGELLASARGLGHELSRASATLQIPELYVYILVTLGFVVIFNSALSRFEARQHLD